MAEELAYVLINPYTIIKSRTGGVISRLLSRTPAELVCARMFAPSRELIEEYVKVLGLSETGEYLEVQKLIKEYLLDQYAPDKITQQKRRVMLFLFRGEDAVSRLRREVVGHITKDTLAGETIRDTYGDYIVGPDGAVKYFEPAVIASTSHGCVEKELAVWAKYSDTDSGVLKDVVKHKDNTNVQNTLILLKPDCFQWPSSRPGSIIDAFSKTGLYIIGAKVFRMSVNQALEFYGPVKEVLLIKFNGDRAVMEEQFNKIIKFMTGLDMETVPEDQRFQPGKVKCLGLIYQGDNAVPKIRNVLGATDPSAAAPATIRREFGKDVLVNTAHASDSVENAKREMKIVDFTENNFKRTIEDFYAENK